MNVQLTEEIIRSRAVKVDKAILFMIWFLSI
jgi:hypothetical protein